jgi:hypothetical protein
MKDNFPVIKCREENGCWVFDCKFCLETHKHGIGQGHRVSHCRSGMYPNGYTLVGPEGPKLKSVPSEE